MGAEGVNLQTVQAQDPVLGPFKGGMVMGEYDIPGTSQGFWVT